MPYDCLGIVFLYILCTEITGGRERTPVHWIIICVSLSHTGLNNNFYELFRCWCGRATLTLLSAVMLSDCSMKFPPKCACLREQPAPQPSTPLARSHLCSTDRQVQTAFCIPPHFHVNFFYPSKYHLHIPFVNGTAWKFALQRENLQLYTYMLPC